MKQDEENIVAMLGDVGGMGPDARAVAWTFRMMAEAEEAIDRARKGRPEPPGMFAALRPRYAVLGSVGDEVVRSHMDELCERMMSGGDPADATWAETCVVLSSLSMAGPFHEWWRTAYFYAFIRAFGEDRAAEVVGEESVRRALDDVDHPRVQDVLDRVRREARDPERRRG